MRSRDWKGIAVIVYWLRRSLRFYNSHAGLKTVLTALYCCDCKDKMVLHPSSKSKVQSYKLSTTTVLNRFTSREIHKQSVRWTHGDPQCTYSTSGYTVRYHSESLVHVTHHMLGYLVLAAHVRPSCLWVIIMDYNCAGHQEEAPQAQTPTYPTHRHPLMKSWPYLLSGPPSSVTWAKKSRPRSAVYCVQ